MARRVRDADLPLGQRVNALHSLLANHHAPFGFRRTRAHLRRAAGVRVLRDWTEPRLLAALDLLEESRASHLANLAAFGQRRRVEKASGRRVPNKGDLEALARREWTVDVDAALSGARAAARSASGPCRRRPQWLPTPRRDTRSCRAKGGYACQPFR